MADKPILFSGPMVRAILEGRKVQTRRVLKPQPPAHTANFYRTPFTAVDGGRWVACTPSGCGLKNYGTRGPERRIPIEGDRLWVKETFTTGFDYDDDDKPIGDDPRVFYAATECPRWFDPDTSTWLDGPRWTSPRFMPRSASRLTLAVTDVRVQRLQEISRDDALAEGIVRQDPTPEDYEWYRGYAEENGCDPNERMDPVWLAPGTRQGYGPRRDDPQWGPTPEFAFRCLWDSLNAKRGYGWEDNPWIVAITFDVHRLNIDQMERAA